MNFHRKNDSVWSGLDCLLASTSAGVHVGTPRSRLRAGSKSPGTGFGGAGGADNHEQGRWRRLGVTKTAPKWQWRFPPKSQSHQSHLTTVKSLCQSGTPETAVYRWATSKNWRPDAGGRRAGPGGEDAASGAPAGLRRWARPAGKVSAGAPSFRPPCWVGLWPPRPSLGYKKDTVSLFTTGRPPRRTKGPLQRGCGALSRRVYLLLTFPFGTKH